MNSAFLLLTCLAASALGADLCLPDALESAVYSFTTNLVGTLAIDFTKGFLATEYPATGRTVFKLADFSGAVIDPSGKCTLTKAPNALQALVQQCLPASAVKVANSTTVLGLPPNDLEIEAWEISLGALGTARLAVTTGANPVPVVRELILNTSNGTVVDVLLFLNPQLKVSSTTIFDIPSDCSAAVVG